MDEFAETFTDQELLKAVAVALAVVSNAAGETESARRRAQSAVEALVFLTQTELSLIDAVRVVCALPVTAWKESELEVLAREQLASGEFEDTLGYVLVMAVRERLDLAVPVAMFLARLKGPDNPYAWIAAHLQRLLTVQQALCRRAGGNVVRERDPDLYDQAIECIEDALTLFDRCLQETCAQAPTLSFTVKLTADHARRDVEQITAEIVMMGTVSGQELRQVTVSVLGHVLFVRGQARKLVVSR